MMEISSDFLRDKAAKIEWFFCDVDGTLTDGSVYYSPDGELLKKFSLRDGTGFFLLKHTNIQVGIITTENSYIVQQRAKKLKVDKYIYGTNRKLEAMKEFVESEGIMMENIAYIGDELNDIKLLNACGLSFSVSDATDRVKLVSDIICQNKGGYGAFREAVDILLNLKGVDVDKIIDEYL